MTESEVKTIDDCINELRKHRNVYLKRSTPWRVVNRALHLIEQYRAIGTVEEFKDLKEKEELFDRNIKMFNEIGLEIRNNAIDNFAEALLRCDVIDKSVIRRIAEQMKGEQL